MSGFAKVFWGAILHVLGANPANLWEAPPEWGPMKWGVISTLLHYLVEEREGRKALQWVLVESLNCGSHFRGPDPAVANGWRGSGRWGARDEGGWYGPLHDAVVAGVSNPASRIQAAAAALLVAKATGQAAAEDAVLQEIAGDGCLSALARVLEDAVWEAYSAAYERRYGHRPPVLPPEKELGEDEEEVVEEVEIDVD